MLAAVGHPAFADVQDNGDVLLLHPVELHDFSEAHALGVAFLLEEIALSDFVEEGDHLPLSLGREAFKIGLDLGPDAAGKTLVLVRLATSRCRHEMNNQLSLAFSFLFRVGWLLPLFRLSPISLVTFPYKKWRSLPLFFKTKKCGSVGAR